MFSYAPCVARISQQCLQTLPPTVPPSTCALQTNFFIASRNTSCMRHDDSHAVHHNGTNKKSLIACMKRTHNAPKNAGRAVLLHDVESLLRTLHLRQGVRQAQVRVVAVNHRRLDNNLAQRIRLHRQLDHDAVWGVRTVYAWCHVLQYVRHAWEPPILMQNSQSSAVRRIVVLFGDSPPRDARTQDTHGTQRFSCKKKHVAGRTTCVVFGDSRQYATLEYDAHETRPFSCKKKTLPQREDMHCR
jgi:hypothetical protein